MPIIYAHGEATIALAANDKIAIFSNSPVKYFIKTGYPNFPDAWVLTKTTTAGDTYTSAAVTVASTVRVEASEAVAYYEVGAAPVINEPLADQSFADATGVISGLAAAQGGSSTLKGGTSSTAANAGGAAALLGGVPGETGVGGAATVTAGAGGSTSGKGGAVVLTGGAGTAGDAAGGSIVLQPGALNGAGLDGGVFNRGTYQFSKQAAPVAKGDGAQSVTGAQMIGGICVQTITGASTLTTPTGALLTAACPSDLATGDSFLFRVITLGAGADDITTLTAGDAGVTFVGDVTVGPGAAGTTSGATFLFRCTGAGTWVGYRVG